MGTRALVKVYDKGEELITLYRQYDGYPSGIGLEIAEFLEPFVVTDGIQGSPSLGESSNGMGCLAAQLVGKLKDRVGNVYLYPAGTTDVGEEYVYRISNENNVLIIKVLSVGWEKGKGDILTSMFSGTPTQLKKFCLENE